MLPALLPAGAALLGAAALLLDVRVFVGIVVLAGVVALVDLSGLLGSANARPVVVTAVIATIALPLVVSRGVVAGEGVAGWELIPSFVAAAFVLTAVLLLVTGRRRRVVAALGATGVAALVVGVGVTALVLLPGLVQGTTWVIAFLAAVAVADTAVVLAARFGPGSGSREDLVGDAPGTPLIGVLAAVGATAVAVGITGVVAEPVGVVAAVALGVIALVATFGGRALTGALAADVGNGTSVTRGLALGVTDAWLLGAPAAYALARASLL